MIGLSLVTATLQRWQGLCVSNLPSWRALSLTQEVWQWQLVRIAVTIRMVSAARGCGSISVMTVASTSATTAEQPQEMAFAALTVTLTTPRRITSATETPTDRQSGASIRRSVGIGFWRWRESQANCKNRVTY